MPQFPFLLFHSLCGGRSERHEPNSLPWESPNFARQLADSRGKASHVFAADGRGHRSVSSDLAPLASLRSLDHTIAHGAAGSLRDSVYNSAILDCDTYVDGWHRCRQDSPALQSMWSAFHPFGGADLRSVYVAINGTGRQVLKPMV